MLDVERDTALAVELDIGRIEHLPTRADFAAAGAAIGTASAVDENTNALGVVCRVLLVKGRSGLSHGGRSLRERLACRGRRDRFRCAPTSHRESSSAHNAGSE